MFEAKKLQLAVLRVLEMSKEQALLDEDIIRGVEQLNQSLIDHPLSYDDLAIARAIKACIEDGAIQQHTGRRFLLDKKYGEDWIRILTREIVLLSRCRPQVSEKTDVVATESGEARTEILSSKTEPAEVCIHATSAP